MPVRRRLAKRRVDPAVELQDWENWFEWGREGFAGELWDYGLRTKEDTLAAMPEAWQRLGAAFMAARKRADQVPYALKQFGDPRCR
jgi:hypothetical protein